MKISNSLFFVFAIVFFAFSMAFMDQQNYNMTGVEGASRFWLMRINLVLDIVCFFVMMQHSNRLIFSGIHLVCLLWLMIMPLTLFLNQNSLADIVQAMLWPLIFESTYSCCYLKNARGSFFFVEYILIFAIGFYYFILTRFASDHQTNTIYFCFLTLPWLLYKTNSKYRTVLLIFFVIMALMSIKRSVILASVLIGLFYIIEKIKKKSKIIYTIVLFSVLIVVVNQLYNKVDAEFGGQLSSHMIQEETTESGRLFIWNETMNMINNSSWERLIIGHGNYGVQKDSMLDISAHNDFLEVIYDYGLLLFALYLMLWWHVLKRCYILFRQKSSLFMPYASSLAIFITMSVVSHLILYANYFNFLVMFWGFTEAIVEGDKFVLIKQKKQIQ